VNLFPTLCATIYTYRFPFKKNHWHLTFFLRKACSLWNPFLFSAYGILSPCSLWNSLPLEIKSSPSHPNFMNRVKSYYHVAKHSTLHLLRENPLLTSVRFMLRLARSPLNINKNRIALAFVVTSKLRFTCSFTVHFMMPHERSFPIGSGIL